MEKLIFGEIVLLEFPYTHGNKNKKRPALILLDTKDGDIIVCRITSKLYDTEFDFEIKNWNKCGLRLPSVIRLHKIASLEKNMIVQIIGKINDKTKQIINNKFEHFLK